VKFTFYNYLLDRFTLSKWVPLAALFAIAGSPLNSLNLLVANFLTALTFLLSFRLLDDLTSISKDRILYPERLLPLLSSHRIYWFISIFLSLLINAFLYLQGFWFLCLSYVLIYSFLFNFPNSNLSLIKYPFLLLLLTNGSNLFFKDVWIYYPLLTLPFIINDKENSLWPFYLSGLMILILKFS
jgi:hypothetical protein